MKVLELNPNTERQELIQNVASDAAEILGVKRSSATPREVMEIIDKTVVDIVFNRPTNIPVDEEQDLLLGALWGVQLERQFDWYWTDVVLDDHINEVAVISPNQEMIIFPFSFVAACINKHCICTLLLSFNMLMENRDINNLPPGEYQNIMLGIHHLIPPYTLEPDG